MEGHAPSWRARLACGVAATTERGPPENCLPFTPMPKYHYTTVDAHGRRAVGYVEATGPDDALRQLADLGLNTDGAVLAPDDESPGRSDRLNLVQSVEVVDEILIGRGELPLGPGLLALAAELGHGRVARAVRRIAAALDAGATIENALDAEGTRFPPHVRGLILAAPDGAAGRGLGGFRRSRTLPDRASATHPPDSRLSGAARGAHGRPLRVAGRLRDTSVCVHLPGF